MDEENDSSPPILSSSSSSHSENEISEANVQLQEASEELSNYIAIRDNPGTSLRIWTKDESEVLKKEYKTYMLKVSGKDKRYHITHRVCKQIKQLWGTRYSDENIKKDQKAKAEWRVKKKQIFNWFLNHGRKESNMKIRGLRRLTIGNVIAEVMKTEVHALTSELSNAPPGSQEWIKFYKRALKTVEDQLDDTQMATMKEKLLEWEEEGADQKTQATNARRHGRRTVKKMDEIKYKTMGMHSWTLECHWDEDDQMVYSIHDNMKELQRGNLDIIPFHLFNPGAFKVIEEAWADYSTHIANVERGRQQSTKESLINITDLQYTDAGLPKCPEVTKNVYGRETRRIQNHLVRIYLTAHYRLALGLSFNSGKAVPWSKIRDDPGLFFSDAYIPENVRLQEPSHMHDDEVERLLKYWREEQKANRIPFKFKSVKGKGGQMVPATYPVAPPRKVIPKVMPQIRSKELEVTTGFTGGEGGVSDDSTTINMDVFPEVEEPIRARRKKSQRTAKGKEVSGRKRKSKTNNVVAGGSAAPTQTHELGEGPIESSRPRPRRRILQGLADEEIDINQVQRRHSALTDDERNNDNEGDRHNSIRNRDTPIDRAAVAPYIPFEAAVPPVAQGRSRSPINNSEDETNTSIRNGEQQTARVAVPQVERRNSTSTENEHNNNNEGNRNQSIENTETPIDRAAVPPSNPRRSKSIRNREEPLYEAAVPPSIPGRSRSRVVKPRKPDDEVVPYSQRKPSKRRR